MEPVYDDDDPDDAFRADADDDEASSRASSDDGPDGFSASLSPPAAAPARPEVSARPSPSLAGQPSYSHRVLQRRRLTTAPRSFLKPPVVDPILAIPHACPVHALAVTPCGSHLFSGGGDGFIRRFAIYESVTGSSVENLTMKQGGHVPAGDRGDEPKPFLEGYWENEDGPDVALSLPSDPSKMRFGPKSVGGATQVSPVYSLAVHDEELWALSGTESGRINLYTVRHDEGQIHHVFNCSSDPGKPPTSHRAGTAVSCLELDESQISVLSGGWDGQVLDWDLHTGQVVNEYCAHHSQISSVSLRPHVKASLYDSKESTRENDDIEMKDVDDDHGGEALPSKTREEEPQKVAIEAPSTVEEEGHKELKDANKKEEKIESAKEEFREDVVPEPVQASPAPSSPKPTEEGQGDLDDLFDGDGNDDGSVSDAAGAADDSSTAPKNGIAVATAAPSPPPPPPAIDSALPPMSDHVILTSGIDGQVYLWDRRMSGKKHRHSSTTSSSSSSSPSPSSPTNHVHDDDQHQHSYIRTCPLSRSTSPWTTSAVWSLDGNEVFVGRRHHSVDIYDIRFTPTLQSHQQPSLAFTRTGNATSYSTSPATVRCIKLPPSSGPVSCVLAWPDGKSILCGSFDNIRLWNCQAEADGVKIPFKIIPGHSSGVVSQMYVTPSQRYLITASGDRGWEAMSNESVVIHEIS